MSPETASAAFAAFTLALFAFLVVFNLGRASMASQARKCPVPVAQFTVPFKGTIP